MQKATCETKKVGECIDWYLN